MVECGSPRGVGRVWKGGQGVEGLMAGGEGVGKNRKGGLVTDE